MIKSPFFKGEKRSFARRGIQKSRIKKDLDSWMRPKSSSLTMEDIFDGYVVFGMKYFIFFVGGIFYSRNRTSST